MPRFPYINFPFPFYNNLPRTPSNHYGTKNTSTNNLNKNMSGTSIVANSNQHNLHSSNEVLEDFNSNKNNSESSRQKNKSNKNNDNYLFDLFGLKIYSDDVLLVSLIYFLYSEGVKDDGLFIVLILLLLS